MDKGKNGLGVGMDKIRPEYRGVHLKNDTHFRISIFAAGQRKAASLARFPRKRTNCKYFEHKILSKNNLVLKRLQFALRKRMKF